MGARSCWLRLLNLAIAVSAGTWAATAAAQTQSLAPSPALRCLTPSLQERPLVYPPDAFERKEGGTVNVQLTFDAPDKAPSVKVLDESTRDSWLVSAVEDRVAAFRLPCLAAGMPPVVLRQEYVFIPNDGRKVVATTPVDEADARRGDAFQCMRHLEGEKRPSYPTMARKQEIEGNVFVELRFKSPDLPPEPVWMAASHGLLKREVERYATGLRLPCMDTEPIGVDVSYVFRLDDGKRTILQDTTLPKLLGAAKSFPAPVYFDLTTMGCPFDVRLTYQQPHRPNKIGQLDAANPRRQPFLDWLTELRLRLPDATNTAVLGDTMTVSVPCMKLDL